MDQIPVGPASSVRAMGMGNSVGSAAAKVGTVGTVGTTGTTGTVGTVGAVGSVVPLQPMYVPPGGYGPVACCPSQDGVMVYPEAVPMGGMGFSVSMQAMKRMGSSSVENGARTEG